MQLYKFILESSFNHVHKYLVGSLSLAIFLGIVQGKMNLLNVTLLHKGYHFIPCENCALVNCCNLWNPKLINDLLLNEPNNALLGNVNHQLSFNPLQEIINGHNSESISFKGGRINLLFKSIAQRMKCYGLIIGWSSLVGSC